LCLTQNKLWSFMSKIPVRYLENIHAVLHFLNKRYADEQPGITQLLICIIILCCDSEWYSISSILVMCAVVVSGVVKAMIDVCASGSTFPACYNSNDTNFLN